MSYYDTVILSESPAPTAYWHVNEMSGSVAHDSTSNGYNSVLSSGVTYSEPGAISGDSDTSILFGANDTFTLPAGLDITSWPALTLEFWAKQSGLWNHVVITASNATGVTTFYLNGQVYTSGSGDAILIDTGIYCVSFSGTPYFAKIALTNGVLSAAQVQRHFLIGQLILNGGFALWGNGTGTASYDTVRVTQYPDPSVALLNAGRAANSLINHNGNFPNNTSVAVQTSTDNGVTWQPNASGGAPIAGISTQLHSTLLFQKGANLLRYWRLTEAVGASTVADSSGNNATGTVHGTITFGSKNLLQGPGEITNTSALLDGTTGYISASTSGLPTGSQPWSLVAMISMPTIPISSLHTILEFGTGATNEAAVLFIDGSGHICCNTYAGNRITGLTAANNKLYHCIASYDGTNLRLFVNGAPQGTLACTPNVVLSYCRIGSEDSSPDDFYGGLVADAAILNIALTQADATALANAALCGVGQVANDSFTSDTHASYTQTNGTGGSGATWTWDTANSRLIAVGGSKAHLLYNGLYAYDTDIWVDLYQSENSGLVWGYQDASDYYSLVINDSGASSNANTATINKVSAGTSTQLATTGITFPAQTHHRFHLTMLSGVITVSMDENTILTYTDSSPLPPGLAGIRNDTGTSYIYALQITPQPVDVSGKYLCVKHTLTTSDPTQTPQITDHQALVSDSTFGTGALVPNADYSTTYVSDNFDDLNTRSGYWWQVGDTSVTFQARNAKNAPFILQSTDILLGSLPTVEYSGDMYRNEQVLKGVFQTSVFSQTFAGDGQSKTWAVTNPVQAPPTITVNGIAQSVGLQGVDSGKAFYWQQNSTAITQDNSGTTLRKGIDVLSVAYLGAYGIDFSLSNTGQISNTISQQQYANTDGTSGIVDAIEDVSSQNMSLDAATDYANQLLQRYGSIARTIKFVTLHPGLKAGHSLPIFIPFLNIFDSVFLVVEVQINVRSINNGIQYVYTVTASEAAALSSWVKYFSKVMRSVTGSKAKV